MVDTVFFRLGVDDDVIPVNEAELPVYAREEYIYRTLERRRWVSQTERHPDEAVRTHMGDERCFAPICLIDGNPPVPGIAISSRKYLGLSDQIDAVVHLRDVICRP